MAVAKVVVAQDPKGRAATVPWAVDLAPAGTHATTPTDSSRTMAVAAAAAGDYHLAGKAPRIPVVARLTTSIVPPMMLGLGAQLQENVGRPQVVKCHENVHRTFQMAEFVTLARAPRCFNLWSAPQ